MGEALKQRNILSVILSFPMTVLGYSGKGMKYLSLLISGKNFDIQMEMNKLSGDDLTNELEKVHSQSNEFRNKVETEEKAKIESEMNQKMLSFKYIVKDSSGATIKSFFDAPSANDVKIFLENEGYEIVEIKERSKYDIDINIGTYKLKAGALSFMLTQLSTYIKAGIPLINSVRILARQSDNEQQRRLLNKVVYQLVIGEKFSVALEKQKDSFPKFLINMVKTAEMTGDLAGTLDEMAEYYTQQEKSRKQMISALIYPAVIFVFAVIAVCFIIIVVVPQFVEMFSSNDAELPGITKFIISASDFLGANWWLLILILIALIFVYRWVYKNVKEFRKTMQTFFMKIPIIGNIIIYSEVMTLTRTLSSLLNHSVFITDSMEILSKISNNEVYKEIINRTLIGLSKGSKISETFKGEWAFPVVAYEMLVTGESTGQLALMMQKVAEHYQNMHTNAVTTIKSLIEPLVIAFLAVAVGFIIVSIILPMFSLYNQL